MRISLALIALVAFSVPAAASAPELDVEPLCADGAVRGVVIKVPAAGVYKIGWGPKACAFGDS